MNKRWYVVRTYSGHEAKVKAYLESETARMNLGDRLSNVMIPSEKVIEVKDGKKKARVKNFFPGYVLVEAVLDKETIHLILEAPSVLGFVPDKNNPAPLQPDEVRRLIGKMEQKEDVELVEIPFRMGDPVKVIEGSERREDEGKSDGQYFRTKDAGGTGFRSGGIGKVGSDFVSLL